MNAAWLVEVMAVTGSLLSAAADWFKARETPVKAWYGDDQGRYAFRVHVQGKPFIVAAKKYLVDGTASFMESKVVKRATDHNAYLLLFVQEGGRRLVFDPETVLKDGVPSSPSDSPRAARGEAWLDVTTSHAVDFQNWIDDRDLPPGPQDIIEDPDAEGDGGIRPDSPQFITDWTGGDGDGAG